MKKTSPILVVLLLTACGLKPAESTPASPAPTSARTIQTTPIPTADRLIHPVLGTQAAEPELQIPTEVCPTAPERAQHMITASIDYAARTVDVQQTVTIPNHSATSLESVVLDVWPNRYPEVFTLNTVSAGGRPGATFDLTGPTLTIALPQSLMPGCSTQIGLAFRLRVPSVGNGLQRHAGYFGWTNRQLNLGHWLPIAAHRQDDTWLIHDPSAIGEQTVADMADWDARLSLANAPGNLELAAPGEVTQEDEATWHVVHRRSRDLALSFSDTFDVRTARTPDSVQIEAYSLGDTLVETAGGRVSAAEHALDMAVRSLTRYGALFGAYPRERLVLVEGDFADGMEFSGLIFVGSAWYERWTGTPQSYLTIISVHEMAHQWWYASVGNDPATAPWLDEALATYSEYLFYEDQFPELRSWWWDFRVNGFVPDGFADVGLVSGSVYRFDDLRSYINAVYLRGARMLHQLRQDLGDEAFFRWLKSYALAGDGQIMMPEAFWSLLDPGQRQQTAATRELHLDGES